MLVENEAQLREIYGYPGDRAKNKVLKSIDKHALNFITKSPFIVVSTADKKGNMDTSPKGGYPGFVKVSDHLPKQTRTWPAGSMMISQNSIFPYVP